MYCVTLKLDIDRKIVKRLDSPNDIIVQEFSLPNEECCVDSLEMEDINQVGDHYHDGGDIYQV